MSLSSSELIINPDGSVYHLHLRPGELAPVIITVGDQDRVAQVSRYFDSVEVRRQHREFITHTGTLSGKKISVISTGIGPDNIDIVVNEIDALFNIDFDSRQVRVRKTALDIVRLGTSGAVQADIPVDSFILSESGIGFDNVPFFYKDGDRFYNSSLANAFRVHCRWSSGKTLPYAVEASCALVDKFNNSFFRTGITATKTGFYGPQGRVLRLPLSMPSLNQQTGSFVYKGRKITNFEMETAPLYALASMLGHRALSLNAILANRVTGAFSTQPAVTVDALIKKTLEIIIS